MNDFGRLLRSQFYSLWREKKLLLIVLAVMTAAGYFMSIVSGGETMGLEENAFGLELDASMLFGMSSSVYATMGKLFVFISVGLFASRDMNDKTMNYEIMNGHERKHVFLSRALVSMILGVGGGLVMFIIIPLVTTIQYGWGSSIAFGTAALRMMLMLLFFARLSAELLLAASLLRKTSFVYIAGVLVYVIELVLSQGMMGSPYVFSNSAGDAIMQFDTFSLSHIDDTSELFFSSSMTAGTAAAVAASYIIASAMCIYIGCRLFCRADIE